MCIICLKPAGVDLPSDEEIKYMFERNPHGAGFAIQGDLRGDGGFGVEYHKGFMNVDDLIEALGPREKLKNFNVAIHCRIKTSGETDQFTTHPFPISPIYGDLRKLTGNSWNRDAVGMEWNGAVLFHNGVFSGLGGLINEKSSDTQDFVVGVATRFLKNAKMPGKVAQAVVSKVAGECRILVMYPKKDFPILRFGRWYEHKGCYYSNMGYKSEYEVTTKWGTGGSYSSHYHSKPVERNKYREELDYWGCNIAEYAWPSADDDWIRFSDTRWEILEKQIASKKERGGETIVTFGVTGVKEWIWDEDEKQIYTSARRADVKLRRDEDDYYLDLYDEGKLYQEEGYIWFDGEEVLLEWLDGCKKVGDYEFRWQNQTWLIDTVNCEAYTIEGIKKYFSTGEQGHVIKKLREQGYYEERGYGKRYGFPTDDDDDDATPLLGSKIHDYDPDYEEELETLRYGRS